MQARHGEIRAGPAYTAMMSNRHAVMPTFSGAVIAAIAAIAVLAGSAVLATPSATALGRPRGAKRPVRANSPSPACHV